MFYLIVYIVESMKTQPKYWSDIIIYMVVQHGTSIRFDLKLDGGSFHVVSTIKNTRNEVCHSVTSIEQGCPLVSL